ncbi:MAG TPA: class IV adenylate cyclase [Thermoanaerobaculia bacterium]|nr:class IV adenylate cyclase [Thermoanaerobaculia bacterium]
MTGGPAERREEIEVKLPASDLDAMRERLRSAGAELHAARHDESNDLYDDPARKLSGSGRTLRLRRAAGRSILTYKGVARFESGARVREEREVEVSDPGEAEGILTGLGLERRFRYEKRREEWRLGGCLVALDETPIGDFVEVEGSPPDIRKLIGELALDSAEAIPYSYPELYQRRRKEEPSLPPDMVWGRP